MSTWLYQGRVNGRFCLMGVAEVDRPTKGSAGIEEIKEAIGGLFKPYDWSVGRELYEGGMIKSIEIQGDYCGDHFVVTAERTA
jgi:hypothetical protein